MMTAADHVLITGASTGIGEACARHLDRLGATVFAGVRKEADAVRLRQGTSRLMPVTLDVTKPEQIEAAVAQIHAVVGDRGLNALVNNAGVVVAGPLEFLPLDEIRWQFEVNVFGLLAVTQACLELLRLAQGRVINMSSIGGRRVTPFIGPYSASKFALEAFTDALRVEVQPWKIDVVSVQPGAIQTPIWDKSHKAGIARLDEFSARAQTLYRQAIETLQGLAQKRSKAAIPAQRVADVVVEALTAERPRTRYLVGSDAHLQATLKKLLSDRALDALLTRVMKLPKRGSRH